jgi:2-dehydro-3-deoxygluconokinase
MAEFVTFGETPLRLSPPGYERLETAGETSLTATGTESNTAVAAAELGAESLWLSKLPETALGRRVVTELEQHGIETDVTWSDDKHLRQGLVFHEQGSAPRDTSTAHDRQYTAAATAVPGELPMERAQNAAVVFTGLSTPALSPETTETTQALVRASGGTTAVTALELDYQAGLAPPERYREAFEGLTSHLDMLFATENSIETVLDRSGSPRELVNILGADYDFEIVVLTQSDGSSVALHNTAGTNVLNERESVDVDVVDTTGTRSAFVGAFLQQLIDGADTATALNYAVAAAAHVQTVPGPFLTTRSGEIAALAERVEQQSQ